MTARTFLVVFRPKNTFKPTWEQDARNPSLLLTHWTYNRSPQVTWFGSHRAMVLGGGTPANSDPPVAARSVLPRRELALAGRARDVGHDGI